MRNSIFCKITLVLAIVFILSPLCFGQEKQEKLTQEEFAQILVRNMKLQNLLPIAPLPSDSVNLLDSLGISPLKGWDRKESLATEDYMVIIARASGKEKVVFKSAAETCDCNIRLINQKWQDYFDKHGRWLAFGELLKDKESFPQGAPACPFGTRYESKLKPHAIDPHFHVAADILRLTGNPTSK